MELLTVRETAELLRVTPQHVYKLARRGDLPVLHIGRAVRVDRDSLADWLAAGGDGAGRGQRAQPRRRPH